MVLNGTIYETKQLYEGGQKIKTDAPISKMPLFVRSGAIIPKASKVNGEADTIEVYSGQDGMFVLYLDNGKDYAYEKGEMTTIPVIWSEEPAGTYDRKSSWKLFIS